MIQHTQQNWQIGAVVRVGFLHDMHVVAVAAVRDYLPDHYLLQRAGVWYRFTPHHGLTRLGKTCPADWSAA